MEPKRIAMPMPEIKRDLPTSTFRTIVEDVRNVMANKKAPTCFVALKIKTYDMPYATGESSIKLENKLPKYAKYVKE